MVGREERQPDGSSAPGDALEPQIDPSRVRELQAEMQLVEQWQFQSPILPPVILQQYEELIPNFSERYFTAWERQGSHRQSLEAKVINAQTKSQLRAQPYAFALGALTLLVAGALGLAGEAVAAIAVVGIDFLGLGGVFVFGRISNVREARRKADAVPDPERQHQADLPANRTLPKGQPTSRRPAKKRKKKGHH